MNGAVDASLDFPCTCIALEKQSERSYTPEPLGDSSTRRANAGVTRLDPAPTILNSFSALNPDFAARLEGKQRSSIMYQALETMRGHIQGSNIKGAFLSCRSMARCAWSTLSISRSISDSSASDSVIRMRLPSAYNESRACSWVRSSPGRRNFHAAARTETRPPNIIGTRKIAFPHLSRKLTCVPL